MYTPLVLAKALHAASLRHLLLYYLTVCLFGHGCDHPSMPYSMAPG